MHNLRRSISILALTLVLTTAAPLVFRATPSPVDPTILIINAQLADGTGAPLNEGALRIRGNRIASIGKLSPSSGDQVIDAHGLVLAPGFIDIHNHSLEGLDSDPLAETQIAQGITTAVQGPDGDSPWPIADWICRSSQESCCTQCRRLRRTRHHSRTSHGQGLQTRGHSRRKSTKWRSSPGKP